LKHLAYLNKYFLKYRNRLILGIIFIIISNIFALYPAQFVRSSFDEVKSLLDQVNVIKNDYSYVLLKYGGLIILFALLKGVFMFFMRQTIIVMSRKIEFDLKNEIYQQYQNLSISFYKKNDTGDMMNRITEDVNRVRMYLGPALMYAISLVTLFILVITTMISISPLLTLYVLFPLPVLAILVYFVSNTMNKRSERVQEQLSTLTTFSQESFSGINILKSFGNEKSSGKKFGEHCIEYTARNLKLVKVDALFFPLIIFMIGLSTIMTVYFGGRQAIDGYITTGNIAEFIIYVNMLSWPVASIGWVTSLIQRAAASQERINEFLNTKSDINNFTDNSTPIRGDIEFKDVSFTYPDTEITALNNISFKIKEGSTLGIFGKTGSGKSTIANLICRIYDVESGNIIINKDLKELNLHSLRKAIGYVPQDGYLFSGTVEENISFGSDRLIVKKVKDVAKSAEITSDIKKFSKGYKTIVGERGVQLSGGQRQRIAIARAIYKNPNIYIFDDCLSAVDSNKEQKILANLKKETNNATTVIISHRISAIKDADLILVLKDGRIIEKGKHQSLLKNRGFYYEIFEKQTKKEHQKLD
jgi:ATP-binding cassette subfamily B protein|tara:strand:- start:1098 stop:2858 length:1761 start_codon:yes stop_codon:yes gene_type:complete